jgi:hypothetical protein
MVPDLVDGDRLLHTELHGDQFIIGADHQVRVIDWGFPGVGAPWVDSAFLTLRLIEAGHRPEDAEAWASHWLPCWAQASGDSVTAFAVYLAGMWTHWTITDPTPGTQHRAQLARDYAAWRLTAASSARA